MPGLSVSLVLPTYNEKQNITILVREAHALLTGRPHEIIVVDDRSPDGTGAAVAALMEEIPELRLVLKDREGLGAALRRGYEEARNDVIVSMDADLSFSSADIARLVGRIEGGFDLALGCRYADGGAYERPNSKIALKYAVSRIGNLIVRGLTGLSIRDYSANFRAIRREVWRNIRTTDAANSLLLEMILKTSSMGFRLCEVPVVFTDRKHGESKLNLFVEVPRYLLRLGRHLAAYRRS